MAGRRVPHSHPDQRNPSERVAGCPRCAELDVLSCHPCSQSFDRQSWFAVDAGYTDQQKDDMFRELRIWHEVIHRDRLLSISDIEWLIQRSAAQRPAFRLDNLHTT